MEMPEYVTVQEVRRVCRELGFRDWTQLHSAEVSEQEAEALRTLVGAEALQIPVAEFRKGLEVELEHGRVFPDANVTNNHPLLTARIVLAHLKEMLDYYSRLEVAELEGDMLKASRAGDAGKVDAKYQQWLAARHRLSQWETSDRS